MEQEICDNCFPFYTLLSVAGLTCITYISYASYKYIFTKLSTEDLNSTQDLMQDKKKLEIKSLGVTSFSVAVQPQSEQRSCGDNEVVGTQSCPDLNPTGVRSSQSEQRSCGNNLVVGTQSCPDLRSSQSEQRSCGNNLVVGTQSCPDLRSSQSEQRSCGPALYSLREKFIGMAINTYCNFRWTKDQLARQLLITAKLAPKFLISRIWKMEGDMLVSIFEIFEPEQAEKFEIISLKTMGLDETKGSHYNYLIEYYWRATHSRADCEVKFLLPCPGPRLLAGLETQANWMFDETTPEEFTQFKFNLNSDTDLKLFTEMLVQYAGPLQNFYQGSDFEVTGRKIFSTLNGKRMLSYIESIEVVDPILEEKLVFKL